MDETPVTILGRQYRASLRRILVSGCLNGPAIRYNRTNVEVVSPIWDRWEADGLLVPFCAEISTGFPIPRPAAEIRGGDGSDVRSGTGVVAQLLIDNGIRVFAETQLEEADRFVRSL